MGSALIYVVVVALVAAVIYLGAALVFGRGEELAPMPPGATPTRLPARDLAGHDVRELRFQTVLRGYRMSEVDWALARLADEVDELRLRLAAVETGADPRPDPYPADPHPAGPNPAGSHPPDPLAADPSAVPAAGDPTPEVRHGRP